jgi:hypothetical protein
MSLNLDNSILDYNNLDHHILEHIMELAQDNMELAQDDMELVYCI